ncbi:MAG TPA: hypothetical protein VFR86_16155 [Burkholderiaceae bacterium]|nr:hypothetical protein [Burkholderiaceae bacterium]
MSLLQLITSPMGRLLTARSHHERRRYAVKPRIGATLVCSDLRMTVQAGMSNELWRYLCARGWREIEWAESRHKLRAVPSSVVTELFDAGPDRWERLLEEGIRQAIRKPTLKGSAMRVTAL